MSITKNFEARAKSREKARLLADEMIKNIVASLRHFEDAAVGCALTETADHMERALVMVHSELQAIIRNAQAARKPHEEP